MIYKVVLALKLVDKTLLFDHWIERHWAVLWCGDVSFALQDNFNFQVHGLTLSVLLFKQKPLSNTLPNGFPLMIYQAEIEFETDTEREHQNISAYNAA